MNEEKTYKNRMYEAPVCPCCGQTTTYLVAIDRMTVKIVRQIAVFIRQKGFNRVHPRLEMEGTYLSSNEVGNLSRARFHGLIASAPEAGNYLLTKKGSQFLNGKEVPKYAIVSKSEGCQIGYFEPEKRTCMVYEFADPGEYIEPIGYEIVEGEVISTNPQKK